MRHITVTVEDETYRQIRAWCALRDTCVSHVVQALLNDLTRMEEVKTFPLPGAPDPRCLGAIFDRCRQREIDQIQRRWSSANLVEAEIEDPTPPSCLPVWIGK